MDDVIFCRGTTHPPVRATWRKWHGDDRRTTTVLAPLRSTMTSEVIGNRRGASTREAGSAYKDQYGKDVRARDVQLLFADVSTGVALARRWCGKGQIAELINAKPQAPAA